MPVGTDTYKGLGLPNQGNANLKAASTATAAFTVTLSSGGAGGQLLVLRNHPSTAPGQGQDSTLLTQDQLRVSSIGAFQWTSNNSVVQTISTAGIVGGAESTLQAWAIDSSGRFGGRKVPFTAYTSVGSTLVTLATSQSGQTILYTATSGGMTFTLPTTGDVTGLEYNIVTAAANAGVFVVSSTGHAADIVLAGGAQNSTGMAVSSAASPGSTHIGHGCRLLGISSIRWLLEPFVSLRTGFTSVTMEGAGTWASASTIA